MEWYIESFDLNFNTATKFDWCLITLIRAARCQRTDKRPSWTSMLEYFWLHMIWCGYQKPAFKRTSRLFSSTNGQLHAEKNDKAPAEPKPAVGTTKTCLLDKIIVEDALNHLFIFRVRIGQQAYTRK